MKGTNLENRQIINVSILTTRKIRTFVTVILRYRLASCFNTLLHSGHDFVLEDSLDSINIARLWYYNYLMEYSDMNPFHFFHVLRQHRRFSRLFETSVYRKFICNVCIRFGTCQSSTFETKSLFCRSIQQAE